MQEFAYDAFISYSRAADRELALALQYGLHTFAKPWHRLRALRVFRDEGSLAAGPRLWGSIERALDSSRHLILLASADSARAPWVEKEVEHWCARRGTDNLLIVLTEPPAADDDAGGGGARRLPGMVWDADRNDFDWRKTTVLPRCLAGRFHEMPLVVPLGWARARSELSLRDPDFRTAVAGLAAAVRGVEKDTLIGEDVRLHRRTRHTVRSALALLTALAVTASIAAVTAVRQRDLARDQTALAEVRQYVAQSRNASDPYVAVALAIAAEQRITPALPEARAAFGEALRGLESWSSRLVGEVPLETSGVFGSLSWSADGTQVRMADIDGRVSGWTVRDGRAVQPLQAVAVPTGTMTPDGVRWSPDGGSLLSRLHDGDMTMSYLMSDAVSGRVTAGPFTVSEEEGFISDLALSPRGKVLATSQQEGIKLWDVGTGRRLGGPLPGSRADNYPLMWSPDGGRLATVGTAGTGVWDADRGTLLWSDRRAVNDNALSWSPDGSRVVTGGHDGTVRWWDARTGALSTASSGQHDPISQILWSPDGARLAVADDSGTIRLWDAGASNPVATTLARDSKHVLRSLAWSPDGRFLAGAFSSDIDGGPSRSVFRLWEVARQPPPQAGLSGPAEGVLALAWSPEGRHIAGGGNDAAVWIWDAVTGDPVPGSPIREQDPRDHAGAIAWDPSGRRLLLATGIGLRVWSATTTADTSRPWWGSGGAVAVAWSPDGTKVADGTDQGQVRVWDPGTGRPAAEQPDHATASGGATEGGRNSWTGTGGVQSVAWSPDNRRLAAVLGDGSLHRWDADSGRPLGPAPQASPHLARSMAWSPDGALIATGGVDGTIRLWDGGTGRQLPTELRGGDSVIDALVWSPDSTALVSGDDAGTIRVWDPRRYALLQQRDAAHPGGVTALSWSPDGSRLVSGGRDKTVRLWQGTTEQEACRLVAEALRRTPTTPELSGATGSGADICSRPSRIRDHPLLPLLPARRK
ncbi:toll/interleukin-1 receptor domain-containing protein [Streptomyces sp. NPDC002587]